MDKKEKNTRNIVIAAIVLVVIVVIAVAAILASKSKNSEQYLEQLNQLRDRAELLEMSAEDIKNDGELEINDYEVIITLKMKADDAIIKVNNGNYSSKEISTTIKELEEDLNKYEKIISDIVNGDGALTAVTEEEYQTDEESTQAAAQAVTQAAAEAEPVTETTTAALTENVSSFIASIQEFQNECSLRHDKGEISEEQYMDILQLEIEAAQVMEAMKAGGDPDDLDAKADELSAKIYVKAEEVNSPLADNFKK